MSKLLKFIKAIIGGVRDLLVSAFDTERKLASLKKLNIPKPIKISGVLFHNNAAPDANGSVFNAPTVDMKYMANNYIVHGGLIMGSNRSGLPIGRIDKCKVKNNSLLVSGFIMPDAAKELNIQNGQKIEIGYRPLAWIDDDITGIRTITRLELLEISIIGIDK